MHMRVNSVKAKFFKSLLRLITSSAKFSQSQTNYSVHVIVRVISPLTARQVTDLTMAPGASSGPTITVQTTSQAGGQASQQSNVQTQQALYQSHVQYVPGPDHHHRHSTIYANGAM